MCEECKKTTGGFCRKHSKITATTDREDREFICNDFPITMTIGKEVITLKCEKCENEQDLPWGALDDLINN